MKTYYLWTIGCQMNDADAARAGDGLAGLGLLPVSDPTQADLVVLVTCVVRQSAEDRVVGRLSSLKHLKRTRPATAVVVMGCFVHDVPALRERFRYVDAFLEPSDVPGLLEFARSLLSAGEAAPAQSASSERSASVCAMVPISLGCDHHCTYCIVRLRRGKQSSRPLAAILQEVQDLVERGAREVTLLGQNVDAYGKDLPGQVPDLADVLTAVHAVEGLWRVRFLTSHPAHMSDKLVGTVSQLPKVCPHFELPVQAGDDAVLQRMGRGYSVAHFRQLVARVREQVPGASVATDVIVGFPAESDAQFQGTYDLVASLHFDAVHIAKYSPRPGTPSARLPDNVPPAVKERRRLLLEELQTRIALEINQSMLEQAVDVLVEESRRGKWRGRTVNNKLVFFVDDASNWKGCIARVRIVSAGPWSLSGQLLS